LWDLLFISVFGKTEKNLVTIAHIAKTVIMNVMIKNKTNKIKKYK
jgi:hypothetical protein